METYKNPNCKKVRGSHILEVSCAYCKCFIANYQKVGESNFVKMYNDRIIDGSIDFSQYLGAIFCPECGERIATRYMTKMDKKDLLRKVNNKIEQKQKKFINKKEHSKQAVSTHIFKNSPLIEKQF
jgi:hypothetical protein